MKLHYQITGTGQALVIIHGLFGSSDNWRGLAKQLANHAQVITVDLRNHGKSPHSSQQNYDLMVEDLVELFDDLNLNKADIIGHSIGGKVAMAFAAAYPERLNKLVVVDISPREYAGDSSHIVIFEALLAVDLSLYSKRSEVNEVLSELLPDKSVRQFLLMNISQENGRLIWRINLQALYNNYANFGAAVGEQMKVGNVTCFIRGGRSGYIQANDELLIAKQFPRSEIFTIEQAGHWVHSEAPQQFLSKVNNFLNYD
ncbi:MAG: alpha/beta fold hydrolase [Methylophaga sp.]|nr:alpha/beta fold hydrolase [Methylophaga sp.]